MLDQKERNWLLKYFGDGGWTKEPFSIQEEVAPFSWLRGNFYKLQIGSETLAYLFPLDEEANEQIKDVISFSYHRSIPWVILKVGNKLKIYNSTWLREGEWYETSSLNIGNRKSVLIEPKKIIDGELEKSAIQPERRLMPVDDALMERLNSWRRIILRQKQKAITNADTLIHELISRLFVLRACEDRKLLKTDYLREYSKKKSHSVNSLKKLFIEASEELNSELFKDIELPNIAPEDLTSLLSDLYIPRQAKGLFEYNFAWLSTDVLGRAYQRYVSYVMVPVPLNSLQGDLYRETDKDIEESTQRKQKGIYYTPDFIVKYLVSRALMPKLKEVWENEERLPSVADISCGSGSFLTAACKALLEYIGDKKQNKKKVIKEIFSKKIITGFDVDERAVLFAKLNLWLLQAEESALPLEYLNSSVSVKDGLSTNTKFDVILGNPPFIPANRLEDPSKLRRKFPISAKGRYDYSYLFVEHAISLLKPGGILAFVIPNRILTSRDANGIREFITEKTEIIEIVDFGYTQVFDDGSSYIALIILKRKNDEQEKTKPTTRPNIIKIESLPGKDNLKGVPLWLASVHKEATAENGFEKYNASPQSGESWLFISDLMHNIKAKIERSGNTLADHEGAAYQGIKTGANDIFLLKLKTFENNFFIGSNLVGEECIIERDLVRPAVIGSEIKKYLIESENHYIIYPYNSSGELIPEDKLESFFPNTNEYLKRYRNILLNRISSPKLSPYGLIRSRDLKWLTKPKIISGEMVNHASFATDQNQPMFPIGGIAIDRGNVPLSLLLAILNSSTYDWYMRMKMPQFGSGYIRYNVDEFDKLIVPDKLLKSNLVGKIEKLVDEVIDNYSRKLSSNKIENELNGYIDKALELTKEESEAISRWLQK